MNPLTSFKADEIGGRLGIDLDKNIAYRIGAAFAAALEAKTIILGRDVRASSENLAKSVAQGPIDQGYGSLIEKRAVGKHSVIAGINRLIHQRHAA